MGAKSRRKGAAGEREAAAKLTELFGCTAHRGRQYHGGDDSPDVKTSIHGVHFEVKRAEKLDLYGALKQASDDSGDAIPVVLHRRNNHPWVAILELDQLRRLATMLSWSAALEEAVCHTNTTTSS